MADVRYRLSPAASRELDEILTYVRERSPKGADRLYQKFMQQFDRIGLFPQSGSLRPWITDRPVRFATAMKYQIVYIPEESPAYIIYIFHGARDIKSLLAQAHDLP